MIHDKNLQEIIVYVGPLREQYIYLYIVLLKLNIKVTLDLREQGICEIMTFSIILNYLVFTVSFKSGAQSRSHLGYSAVAVIFFEREEQIDFFIACFGLDLEITFD